MAKLIRSYSKFKIDYFSDEISFRSTKHKKNHKKTYIAFIVAYFNIHLVCCIE